MIGFTRSSNGNKVLIEYTSAGSFKSRTTSNHVGAARVAADEIIYPKELVEEYKERLNQISQSDLTQCVRFFCARRFPIAPLVQ